jgi:hypothetical protein
MHQRIRSNSLNITTDCNPKLEVNRRTINEKNNPTTEYQKKMSYNANKVKFKKKEKDRLCKPNTIKYGIMYRKSKTH